MQNVVSIPPPVTTVWVAANKEERHTFFSPCSCLEENCFSMTTLRTSNRFCTRQSWICCYILQYLCAFCSRMVYLISVHTVVFSRLLMVAITASIKEDLLLLIFLWIQNVVTFSAKFHSTHFLIHLYITAKLFFLIGILRK